MRPQTQVGEPVEKRVGVGFTNCQSFAFVVKEREENLGGGRKLRGDLIALTVGL